MNPPFSRSSRFVSFAAVLVFASSGALGAADDPDPGPDPEPAPEACPMPVWPEIEQLTDSGSSPDVSGERVVWRVSDGNYDIGLWECGSITAYPAQSVMDEAEPAISGDEVVYLQGLSDPNYTQLMLWDESTELTTTVASSLLNPRSPAISDGWVVWEADLPEGETNPHGIFVWKGGEGTQILSGGPYADSYGLPDISGEDVVWEGRGVQGTQVEVQWDVKWWNADTGERWNVQSGDYKIIYGGDVYFHDRNPRVSNGRVVYERCSSEISDSCEIFVNTLGGPQSSDQNQTLVSDSGLRPDISSEGVVYSKEVWTGEDYLPAIFYWDGTDTTQISDPGQVRKPRIDGASIVWEDDSGGIYLTTVPEPAGGLLAACSFGVLAALAYRRRA